ncbi:hypothetical protein M441DRAFT_195119 [Trichoderma asperellum CBS 433.97]|uniref:Uncharacterized protein n=1 Tax=Trichoderma asperellum (strain ATCC 204424 / CBS 433.97 / NBRC 101777) TaxID=1042311 RepID=A0A2T3Z547_TRIA4|nr:hypothetical protein M441DRAFT_195119 [Trichoderma asperellum CBS 433.97]PTB39915.1 hypothetical protein M441DRAFT_195119 [Trichoderma asperellum CBS 433.97]
MSMEDALVPSPVPGPMPPGSHPPYVFSAVPPQQHDGGMILHPSHSMPPSIYPPHPPPPQGGCFPLLHMVPYQMIPNPTDQPQQPDQIAFAIPVTYWPHRNLSVNLSVGNASSHVDQQNPGLNGEQADHRSFGHPIHSHPHFIPYVQVPYMPHHIPEGYACPPNLEVNKAIDQGSHIVDKSGYQASDNETKPSDYYQSVSEKMQLPSAVDSPQAREKTGEEDRQWLQQSHQVPLGPQPRHSISNQPMQQVVRFPTMQSSSVVTSPSSRFSRRSQVTHRPVQTSTEVASWSQSKRWVSSETKERRAFQKMILNLQFMKADQSPFIPKTPAELTKFKVSLAEAKRQKLAKEVKILEEKTRNKELAKASGSKPVSQPQVLLFNGREMKDKLSPVFAAQNCFNKEDTATASQRVEWPSLAELKEEGDKRARFGRYLPLPRMNVVAPKILEREQESAYKADGSIL